MDDQVLVLLLIVPLRKNLHTNVQ